MIQYAQVEPYWPDVFWYYWNVLVVVAGKFMLSSAGLYACYRVWKWHDKKRTW